jgi:hypothetical protein
VVKDNEVPAPGRLGPRQSVAISRARHRLLCSTLTIYAYGLVALAVAPTLIAMPQPPVWITVGEIGLAMGLLALAFYIAPTGES